MTKSKNISILKVLTGTICLFSGLLVGVPLVICGLMLFNDVSIAAATKQDATGLGIILVPIMIIPGIVISCLLFPAAIFLKFRPKVIALTVISVTILLLLVGHQNYTSIFFDFYFKYF